jgi:hypothetical protein
MPRELEEGQPIRPQAIERVGGRHARRPARTTREVATGTLACPDCDAPVLPAGAMSPADPLACGFCGHEARVRDFLSLGQPTRPTRVAVRIR